MRSTPTNQNTYLDKNMLQPLDKDVLKKLELLCKTLSDIQKYGLKGGKQHE